jgi:hypothetical protein
VVAAASAGLCAGPAPSGTPGCSRAGRWAAGFNERELWVDAHRTHREEVGERRIAGLQQQNAVDEVAAADDDEEEEALAGWEVSSCGMQYERRTSRTKTWSTDDTKRVDDQSWMHFTTVAAVIKMSTARGSQK